MPNRSTASITQNLVRTAKPAEKPYEIRDSKLRGFILRVQPTGTKTYYCEWGRGKRSRIGDAELITPTRAREEAEQRIAGAKIGEIPKPQIRSGVPTLEAFLKEGYRTWAVANQKAGEANVKRLESCGGALLDTKLDRIRESDIESWIGDRKAEGAGGSTVKRDFNQLKACLYRAMKVGLIDANPAVSVSVAGASSDKRVRYLSTAEEKALMTALDARETRMRKERASANKWRKERGKEPLPQLKKGAYADYLKPMVIVAMHTGLRWGELASATWPHVKLRSVPTITVRSAHAKSSKERHVPLNTTARKTLVRWKKQRSDSELVFPGRGGKRMHKAHTAWTSVLKAAGIKDFRWHDLRHHFASSLVMKGADLNVVRELLGHQTIDMTLRYSHLAPEHKAAAVALIE